MNEMKTSKEKLIHLHNSEKSSLLQKHETQLSTLNDTIDTHLREKKANELVSILRAYCRFASHLYHRILTHKFISCAL